MSAAPDVIAAVRQLLDGRTRERSITGAELAAASSSMLGRPVAVRRVGEAVEALLQRMPICSSSALGYWLPRTAEEIEDSLREVEKRARMTLRRRRMLRTALAEFQGQTRAEGM